MSDEPLTINVTPRAVIRDIDHMYYVFEWKIGHGWRRIEGSRGYSHSTSAYAVLGRITNRESQQLVMNVGR